MKVLLSLLQQLRVLMDPAFANDTAVSGGWRANCPSAGHCAVAAIAVQRVFGGEFVSAVVDGQSHWFNRIGMLDVDVTGDQFGRARVQVAAYGELYKATRVRSSSELNDETKDRASRFIWRMGEE